jgi:hypothetical protein
MSFSAPSWVDAISTIQPIVKVVSVGGGRSGFGKGLEKPGMMKI